MTWHVYAGSHSSDAILAPPSSGLNKRLSHLTFRGNGNGSNTPGPSDPKTSRKAEGTKRKRSSVGFAKIKDIRMAKKKAARRNNLRKHEWFFVFVGNIKPTVSEDALRKVFAHCGTVTRIQIRCSRGGAVTIGQVTPNAALDFQYATVEFLNANAVQNALELNGSTLHGAQLVVSVSAADLPEVKDIVHKHLGGIRERKGLDNPWKVKPAGTKPLTTYQTELSVDAHSTQVGADRHWMWGISFGKCVM